jgi:site-specific recombinase XerD
MTPPVFVSVLAGRLTAFLRMRRALGFELRTQPCVLRRFDRVAARHMRRQGPVTRLVVEAYLRALDGLSPLTRRNQLCHVRQFLLYLRQFEPATFIPGPSLTPAAASPRAPHIYSEDEIRALLRTARNYPDRYRSRRWLLYETLIGFLYVTGMRVSEALALTLGDIDWRRGVVRIRRAKFHKERLVPLASSTQGWMRRYLIERAERGHSTAVSAALFVTDKGEPLSYGTAQQAIRVIAIRAGIRAPRQRGPRIHDLRHTAAVRRLYLWYRAGKDVQALLPALVTYLGHARVSSTDLYITMTGELLEQARKRFERHLDSREQPA